MEKWAVIELGFLAALQAVIGGFDSHTVHQSNSAEPELGAWAGLLIPV